MKKQDVPSISKEDAEEFSQSLGQIVTGSYRQILLADKMQVPQALGFPSLREWVTERIGGYIKYTIDERCKIEKELNGEGMSARKIAAIMGVNETTVRNDLKSAENSAQTINVTEENAENSTSLQRHQKKKSAAEIEVELHRAADQGVEALIWDKVKDRFLPFWENLLNSLEEDERPFLIWAVHTFADQYEEKRANQ